MGREEQKYDTEIMPTDTKHERVYIETRVRMWVCERMCAYMHLHVSVSRQNLRVFPLSSCFCTVAPARYQSLLFLPLCLPYLQTFPTAKTTSASQLLKPGLWHMWPLREAPQSKPLPAHVPSPTHCSLASFREISLRLGK